MSMKETLMWGAVLGVVLGSGPGCSGNKEPVEAAPVPVEETLKDPTCKDEAIRLCLHRFPAPDVERKAYESCLQTTYGECLAP